MIRVSGQKMPEPAANSNFPPLRLGVIGMSEGNGHPYSWSAIINGYDVDAMATCPFPAIPQYLAKQTWLADRLTGALVTHVWTQDPNQSEDVAKAARIDHVVGDWREMVDQVDGLLLARDDAQNHKLFASPFLAKGKPVYIDKPLALSRAAAEELLSLEQWPGQIYSGTALTQAKELKPTPEQLSALGKLQAIQAVTPKYWQTYAVHIIEPVLALIPDHGGVLGHATWHWQDRTRLSVQFVNGVSASFAALGQVSAPIALELFGDRGHCRLQFQDSFSAFRAALAAFIEGVQSRKSQINRARLLQGAELIGLGMPK